jgi:hypothetical protein
MKTRPKTVKSRKQATAKPNGAATALRRRFERRWRELSAKKGGSARSTSRIVISSLATLAPAGAAAVGDPEIVLVVRRRAGQGTQCDDRAEIAGWYYKQLQGAACIGEPAVKAALDAAAAALCCSTIKCDPAVCPCRYIPQPRLAIYRCTNTEEEGFLLQGSSVWNCLCLAE